MMPFSGVGGDAGLVAFDNDHRSTAAGQLVRGSRRDDTAADHDESGIGRHDLPPGRRP